MSDYLDGGNIVDAISLQVKSVKGTFKPTSLTFLLSDGVKFYAYRDYRAAAEYYGMYYTRLQDCVVFAQEKFFKADWVELKNGELVVLDREAKLESLEL